MDKYDDIFEAVQKGTPSEVQEICIDDPDSVNTKNREKQTPLHVAASNGKEKIVRVLIEQNATKDIQDGKKQTPLHLAAVIGNDKVIVELCKGTSLNPDIQDINGQTALHLAASKGSRKAIQELLRAKATPTKIDKNKQTPLHVAAAAGRVEAVEELTRDEINPKPTVPYPNMLDHQGWTALHYAISKGYKAVAEALKKAGANIEIRIDKDKTKEDTILHQATRLWGGDAVQILLDLGAKKDIKDKEGLTPLYIAAHNGKNVIAELLVGKGGDVNAMENSKRLLLRAAERGDVKVVTFLIAHKAKLEMEDEKRDDQRPLHLAASSGKTEVVSLLLRNNAVPNHPDKKGWTPLYHAVSNGHHAAAEVLLKKGATMETTNEEEPTLLHRAAREGNKMAALSLLQLGAKQNIKDKKLRVPLHVAAEAGKTEVVSILADDKTVLEALAHQWTPLGYAIFGPYEEAARVLKKKGANLERADRRGNTYLHQAAQAGKKEVVELLLKLEANVSALNKKDETPLYVAARCGCNEVADLLTKDNGVDKNAIFGPEEWTLLHRASSEGDETAVQSLLALEVNLNEGDCDEKTPLHLAVSKGALGVVKKLVGKDAKINVPDNKGWTSLHVAAASTVDGTLEIVQELVKKQPKWDDIVDKNKQTPLHIAAANTDIIAVDIVREIQDKLKKDAKDDAGQTALHVAASKGNADIVEALVDFGCDKDAQDKKKRTPLHLAIENGHLNVVESLLGKEVDLDAGEEHDWTALHLATIKGNEDIVDRLLETGKVKQELPDADYHTALYYAVIHGHRSIAVRLGERLENSNEFVIFLIEHHEKRNEMLGNMAENGTLEAVKLLLEVGADVNSLNSRGNCNHWTPLHLAAGSGHLPVVEFLISKDANKDAKCYCYGYTPISYARNSNQMHIVEYLESV